VPGDLERAILVEDKRNKFYNQLMEDIISKCQTDDMQKLIPCEIQIRTALHNTWAKKYRERAYKQFEEKLKEVEDKETRRRISGQIVSVQHIVNIPNVEDLQLQESYLEIMKTNNQS